MVDRLRHVAVVILEDGLDRVCLQLRDDKPTIPHPNQWALFGGHVEEGEEPVTAVLREIAEELTISLSPNRLVALHRFRLEAGKEHHLFRYSLNGELQHAVLTEGQQFRHFSAAAIRQGRLDSRSLVPSHEQMLYWYWRQATLAA